MNTQGIHTSNRRKADRIWKSLGGSIATIRRTGEIRYMHRAFGTSLRINGRRQDVPAKLLTRINQLSRMSGLS